MTRLEGKTAEITESSDNGATVANILDGTKYFMNVAWNTPAKFYPINPNGNGFYLLRYPIDELFR